MPGQWVRCGHTTFEAHSKARSNQARCISDRIPNDMSALDSISRTPGNQRCPCSWRLHGLFCCTLSSFRHTRRSAQRAGPLERAPLQCRMTKCGKRPLCARNVEALRRWRLRLSLRRPRAGGMVPTARPVGWPCPRRTLPRKRLQRTANGCVNQYLRPSLLLAVPGPSQSQPKQPCARLGSSASSAKEDPCSIARSASADQPLLCVAPSPGRQDPWLRLCRVSDGSEAEVCPGRDTRLVFKASTDDEAPPLSRRPCISL